MEDILQEIKKGESRNLEFKQELPKSIQIAQTAVAFSNCGGGKILIGVSDVGEIVGIGDEDPLTIQEKICNVIHDNCKPDIKPDTMMKNIEGKIIIVTKIYPGSLTPYYIKNKGKEKGTYIRIGSLNKPAGPDRIIELERKRFGISFDDEIFEDGEIDLNEIEPIITEYKENTNKDTKNILQTKKLIKKIEGEQFPTRGLMILLGKHPGSYCKCGVFKGNSKVHIIDNKEFDSDIFSQIKSSLNFIKNNIHLISEIKDLIRKDRYEIPETALREALINAFLHRDYSIISRSIEISIYDDYVDIISPGGLPDTLTEGDFFSGTSDIRNERIASVFKDLGYCERFGTGISRILYECREAELKEPEFTFNGRVKIRFYRPKQVNSENDYSESEYSLTNENHYSKDDAKGQTSSENIESDVKDIPQKTKYTLDDLMEMDISGHVLNIIKFFHALKSEEFTTSEAAERLKRGKSTMRQYLKEAVDKGLLIRRGKGKNTYYSINYDKIDLSGR